MTSLQHFLANVSPTRDQRERDPKSQFRAWQSPSTINRCSQAPIYQEASLGPRHIPDVGPRHIINARPGPPPSHLRHTRRQIINVGLGIHPRHLPDKRPCYIINARPGTHTPDDLPDTRPCHSINAGPGTNPPSPTQHVLHVLVPLPGSQRASGYA